METDEIIIVMPARGVADRGEQRAREPLSVMGTLPASAGPYNSQDDRSQAPAHVAGAIAVDAPPQAPARHTRLAEPATAQTYLRRAWSWVRSRRLTDVHFIALIASVLSIAFYVWFAHQGLTLAYADSISHMMIARRVLLSRTPGLAQLGTTWLPLTHVLMLPLIWSDALTYSGIAGALPSMIAYVVGCVYMLRLGQLCFSSRQAGWIAALAFMLNPSVLYMQGTPMTELDLLCLAIVATYYAFRWIQGFHAADMVKGALATALGTLVRYDAWSLAAALAIIIGLSAWRLRGRTTAEANLLLFGTLAFAGCTAWLIYQGIILGNPLDFLYGPYSAQAQQDRISAAGGLPTAHNPVLSLHVYAQVVIDMVGWPIAVASGLGLILWIWRTRLHPKTLPVYALLVPFAFNWLSLVRGNSIIETPEIPFGSVHTYFNERYGMMMLPAIALFFAYLTIQRRVAQIALTSLLIILCVGNIAYGTPYALQDPLHGMNAGSRAVAMTEGAWIASHCHGGPTLISEGGFEVTLFYSRLPLTDFITDTNGTEYQQAIAYPQSSVVCVAMDQHSANYDPVWVALGNRTDWRHYFVLRATFGTAQIYQRIGSPPQHASAPPQPASPTHSYWPPLAPRRLDRDMSLFSQLGI